MIMLVNKGSRPYQLLRVLLMSGGVLLLSTIAPMSGALVVSEVLKAYFRKKRFERERFLQDLRRLQEKKLVNFKVLGGGKIQITLAERGRRKKLAYDIDAMQLKKPMYWDGKWRLVMFDVPSKQKRLSEALRRKLRELRFYRMQKSVFLTPYPCANEIDFIGSYFGLRNNILLLTVSHFEGEEKLRHYFGI